MARCAANPADSTIGARFRPRYSGKRTREPRTRRRLYETARRSFDLKTLTLFPAKSTVVLESALCPKIGERNTIFATPELNRMAAFLKQEENPWLRQPLREPP